MSDNNQYQFRASKEDTIQLVQQIADLEHKDDLARKLTGAYGKSGKFVFTLRRLASGGAPTYSPKLIGEVKGDTRNSSVHIRFRPSIVIVSFAILMITIISFQFYKYLYIDEETNKGLIFAVISIAILMATILTHFYLKKELKNLFLHLLLDDKAKQLNNLL